MKQIDTKIVISAALGVGVLFALVGMFPTAPGLSQVRQGATGSSA